MDQILYDQLLFDYYGVLLTSKQQRILKSYYEENLTLSEIAENAKTSRQAVHDILKRAHKSLEDYEDKLKLISQDLKREEILSNTIESLNNIKENKAELSQINTIIEQLNKLKDGLEL